MVSFDRGNLTIEPDNRIRKSGGSAGFAGDQESWTTEEQMQKEE